MFTDVPLWLAIFVFSMLALGIVLTVLEYYHQQHEDITEKEKNKWSQD